MVRFSCFQVRVHSHKQKKVQIPANPMQSLPEDNSRNMAQNNLYYSSVENTQCLKKEGEALNNDVATDSSPTERDCRSEEIESKYIIDYDIETHEKAQVTKYQPSEDVTNHRFSYAGSPYSSQIVLPDDNMTDSVLVNLDFPKNGSIFSIRDSQQSDKGIAEKDNTRVSGDLTPCTPPAITKSSSLPSMVSPNRRSISLLQCSRSADDLNALDSRKKGTPMKKDYSIFENDKNNDENPGDDTYETFNYVGSAKDWIIPVPDEGKSVINENSFHKWDEVSSKDLRLKRIEEWVMDIQHCSPFEETNEFDSCNNDQELPKSNDLVEEIAKLEIKVNPGMEAAKRYISSMHSAATSAQLTNLGLVAIPFLSPFVSLKTLNLSGNSIVRITAGALPRGLHVLNLSKNNISTIEGLRELTRLRVLDLSYNRILRIGHGLASCSSLKELYLAGNKISEVEGLHRLLKLNVLDLRFNKISTTKCLGQLAANYNCLQGLSLEGNPAQKNVGDEPLKKYVQSLLPNLTYYNRQSIKAGPMKDITTDRSSRLELKNTRKGTHGPSHGRKAQAAVGSQKPSRTSRHGGRVPPPIGMRTTTQGHQFGEFGSKILGLKNDFSMHRSRSEGTLGAIP